jgi:hypothetical protein
MRALVARVAVDGVVEHVAHQEHRAAGEGADHQALVQLAAPAADGEEAADQQHAGERVEARVDGGHEREVHREAGHAVLDQREPDQEREGGARDERVEDVEAAVGAEAHGCAWDERATSEARPGGERTPPSASPQGQGDGRFAQVGPLDGAVFEPPALRSCSSRGRSARRPCPGSGCSSPSSRSRRRCRARARSCAGCRCAGTGGDARGC